MEKLRLRKIRELVLGYIMGLVMSGMSDVEVYYIKTDQKYTTQLGKRKAKNNYNPDLKPCEVNIDI